MKLSALLVLAALMTPIAFADEVVNPTPPIVEPTDPNEPADPVEAPPVPTCMVDGKDLSTDDVAIVAAINAQELCFQAVKIAQICSSGVSNDLKFTRPAAEKCMAELTSQKPTSGDMQTLKTMRAACTAKWGKNENTIYWSVNAHCHLRAMEWMVDLTAENNL